MAYGRAGYPAVEKLIDTEDFDEINAAFEEAYTELFEMSKRKKGLKTQREARKAMKSLELTLDLLRELLAIKYKLQEEAAKKTR
jgi:predicted DNA-binding WGR domain protein